MFVNAICVPAQESVPAQWLCQEWPEEEKKRKNKTVFVTMSRWLYSKRFQFRYKSKGQVDGVKKQQANSLVETESR